MTPPRPLRILCAIPNYNRRALLLKCLERTVRRLRVPSQCTLDVLAVDNNSDDGSREAVAREFPTVRIINTGANLGASGGFAAGMQYAMDHDYDFVWLSDNDALPSRSILQRYIEGADEIGTTAIIGGTMYVAEAPRFIHEAGASFGERSSRRPVLRMHLVRSTPALRRSHGLAKVSYVAFASMFVPVAIVRRIGLPQNMFLHFEDIEYCCRARHAGAPVYNCFTAVYWHPSGQAKPLTWHRYYDARNSLYAWVTANPAALPQRRRQCALQAAKFVLVGRAALGRLTLRGLTDHLRGVRGRADVGERGFQLFDVATATAADIVRAAGADHLVINWIDIERLLAPYRRLWLGFIARHPDSVYVSRGKTRGRWRLFRVLDASAPEAPRLDPVDPRRLGALVRRAVYLRGPLTSVTRRWRLRGFRKLMWLHGRHVIDSDQVGSTEKAWVLLRCAALWQWLWARRGPTARSH